MANLGKSRQISANISKYLQISANVGKSLQISVNSGKYRQISANLGKSRQISAHIGKYRPLGSLWPSWGTCGIPLGHLGLPWGVFWILLKIGRHFPSNCAVFTILSFKIKPPGILCRILPDLPDLPDLPVTRGSGVKNRCSDPTSTRAGGQDDVS